MLKVSFVFQWVGRPENESPFGFERSWGLLDVQFWDPLGNPMKKSLQGDFFCPLDFISEKTSINQGELCILPPRGARYLSIGFSRAGMMTPKTEIPQWWLREFQDRLADLHQLP